LFGRVDKRLCVITWNGRRAVLATAE